MPKEGLSPERALQRLQQLAREERAAVAASDVEALCRIAELLPPTMNALTGIQAFRRSGVQEHQMPEYLNARTPDLSAVIEEIQAAHAEAEAFLTARMSAIAEQLKQFAAARRMERVYGRRPRPGFSLLNNVQG